MAELLTENSKSLESPIECFVACKRLPLEFRQLGGIEIALDSEVNGLPTIAFVGESQLARWHVRHESIGLAKHGDVVGGGRKGAIDPHKLMWEDGHGKLIGHGSLVELVQFPLRARVCRGFLNATVHRINCKNKYFFGRISE